MRATNIDGDSPCELITVVTGLAGSAAADLLSSGNYTFAFPGALIHFHGVRYLDTELTHERANRLAELLKRSNDDYALSLSQRCIERYLFRFIIARNDDFSGLRTQAKFAGRDDFICFFEYLRQKLSYSSQKLLGRAMNHYLRYRQLWIQFTHALGNLSDNPEKPLRIADYEALALQQIIKYEISSNTEENWTFRENGLSDLQSDFHLLMEFIKPRHKQQVANIGEGFEAADCQR